MHNQKRKYFRFLPCRVKKELSEISGSSFVMQVAGHNPGRHSLQIIQKERMKP